MVRIVVTGGAGFVGARLARELLTSGHAERGGRAAAAAVHGDAYRPGSGP